LFLCQVFKLRLQIACCTRTCQKWKPETKDKLHEANLTLRLPQGKKTQCYWSKQHPRQQVNCLFSLHQKGQIGRGAESARGETPNTNAPSQHHFRACVVTSINCHMSVPVSPPPHSSPFKISPLPTPEQGLILTLSRLLLQIRKPQV